jgi:hypothetical protein
MLRRIFGPYRDKLVGCWRKLHNEELHNLCFSRKIIGMLKSRRNISWVGLVSLLGEKRISQRILVGKPKGNRTLRSPRRRWEGNVKMDLRKVGMDGIDWIGLTQDRDQWSVPVNTVMNLRVP